MDGLSGKREEGSPLLPLRLGKSESRIERFPKGISNFKWLEQRKGFRRKDEFLLSQPSS